MRLFTKFDIMTAAETLKIQRGVIATLADVSGPAVSEFLRGRKSSKLIETRVTAVVRDIAGFVTYIRNLTDGVDPDLTDPQRLQRWIDRWKSQTAQEDSSAAAGD